MDRKPKHLLIFKIIGILGIAAFITGLVLTVKGFGDFETNNFMIGGILTTFGVMVSFLGIFIGFSPEIAKANAKTARYIQEENKDDLTAIATNNAEIMSDAITTTADALRDTKKATKFCKHCGEKIDSDSRFCSSCGKEQ